MKRLLLSLVLLFALASQAVAQDFKRWTIQVAGAYGTSREDLFTKIHSFALTPSIRYNLSPNLGAGLALHLPMAFPRSENSIYHTSGIELQLRPSLEVLPQFRISLSLIGLLGTLGAYENAEVYVDAPPGPFHKPLDYRRIRYRWEVGLRPSISYQFSPKWAVELGYGFIGYRSQRDLDDVFYINEVPPGSWGLDDQGAWGNALRFGLSYSF